VRRFPIAAFLVLLTADSAALAAASYEYYQAAEEALDRADLLMRQGQQAAAVQQRLNAVRLLETVIALRPQPRIRVRTYGLSYIEYFPYYGLGRAFEGLGKTESAIEEFERELAKGEILKSPERARDLRDRLERLRARAAPTSSPTPTLSPPRQLGTPSPTPTPPSPGPTRETPTSEVRWTPSRTPTRTRTPTHTPPVRSSPTSPGAGGVASATPPAATPTETPTSTPTETPQPTLEVRYDQPADGHFTIRFEGFSASGIDRAELYIDGAFARGWDHADAGPRFQAEGPFDLPEGTYEAKLVLLGPGGKIVKERVNALRSGTSLLSPLLIAAPLSVLSAVAGSLFVRRRRRQKALARSFNPYIAGSPVIEEDMFFGRTALLQQVLSTLHNNSLLLFGERRIGKTSLLHSIYRHVLRLQDDEYDFFPVLIDLEGVPEESFFATLVSEILAQLEKRLGELPVRFQPALPKNAYDASDFVYDLRLVVRKLREETSKTPKLLLLLDEVDVLNTFTSRTNQRLRSLFMKTFGRHLGLVMAGVGIRKSWDSEGSPWYNFFEEIPVKPFSEQEARELIRRPVEGIFRYEEEAVRQIIEACEGKPYLVQRCCIACVNRVSAEGRFVISRDDVNAILPNVLGGRE
jgi:conflict system STAND superfamily ATPase